MDVVRTSLLIVICVLAVAGTIVFFGSDDPGLADDEKAIAGSWSGGGVELELDGSGLYALVVGTAGSLECGKWRVVDRTLQMRAKRGGAAATTLLMTQPGFRAGTFTLQPGDAEQIQLELQAALPGERSRPESWSLRRSAGGLRERCP
jgi:hypothetical protein